jgi:hypothetical protein
MPKAIEQGVITYDRGLFEALVPQMGQCRVSLADVPYMYGRIAGILLIICPAQALPRRQAVRRRPR